MDSMIETEGSQPLWCIRNCSADDVREAWRALRKKALGHKIFDFRLQWNKTEMTASCSVLSMLWMDFVVEREHQEHWRKSYLGGRSPPVVKDFYFRFDLQVIWDIEYRSATDDDWKILISWVHLAVAAVRLLQADKCQLELSNYARSASILNALHVNISRWFQWFTTPTPSPTRGQALYVLQSACYMSYAVQELWKRRVDEGLATVKALERLRHVLAVRLALLLIPENVSVLGAECRKWVMEHKELTGDDSMTSLLGGVALMEKTKGIACTQDSLCSKRYCSYSMCPWRHEGVYFKRKQVCPCEYFVFGNEVHRDSELGVFQRDDAQSQIINILHRHLSNDDVCEDDKFWPLLLKILRGTSRLQFESFAVNLGDWETKGSYACHLHIHAAKEVLGNAYLDEDLLRLLNANKRQNCYSTLSKQLLR